MDFPAELAARVSQVEHRLAKLLPPAGMRPSRLHGAMRYSIESGGKRLRPVLLLSAADLFSGRTRDDPMPAAVAIECVHTYSLIHDDLPCMDDDDLRRGRPTAHKAYDEATAVLAGDALLTHAFGLLATSYAGNSPLAVNLVRELADAAGSRRMVGGQMEDLLAEKQPGTSAADLDFIHANKTGAMIEAALVMGGLVGGAANDEIETLRSLGRRLGAAFQIVDDLLDATASTARLGKTAGKDAKAGKVTFVSVHGIGESRRIAREHSDAARAALADLPGDVSFLAALVEAMAGRES